MSFDAIGAEIGAIENAVFNAISQQLNEANPLPDAGACDGIFGIYTHQYLLPCLNQGFASRAASFSKEHLIPAVLQIEQERGCQFHKGALFYDTSVAYFLAGNQDLHEYFLAMTDEEEFRKTGGANPRGNFNLQSNGLAAQTIARRIDFACSVLNGTACGAVANFDFLFGGGLLDAPRYDAWRQTLNTLHQFELFRVLYDVEVFARGVHPAYSAANDNPFVLLRLAKALSHLAQWVESCLTEWQGGGGKTLSPKLTDDPHFAALVTAAGSAANFARKPPHGAAVVEAELRNLLADLAAAPAGAERYWRTLRILYIVRNATAHTIEPALAIYHDRALLLDLIQVAFVSVFVISNLKGRPVP